MSNTKDTAVATPDNTAHNVNELTGGGAGRMKLYHFTYPHRQESIQRLGIVRGDVPIGPTSSFNAPNLTSDPDPENQGWAAGGAKTAMRIEVLIPEEEVWNLQTWGGVCAEFDMDPQWRKAMETVGGDPRHWYIFRGVVDADWITDITHFNEDNDDE